MELIYLTAADGKDKHEIVFRPDQYCCSYKTAQSIEIIFVGGQTATMSYPTAEAAQDDYEGMMFALENCRV